MEIKHAIDKVIKEMQEKAETYLRFTQQSPSEWHVFGKNGLRKGSIDLYFLSPVWRYNHNNALKIEDAFYTSHELKQIASFVDNLIKEHETNTPF